MARTPQSGRQRINLDGGRMPEAATFRALNVPFKGAPRTTDAGANLNRLADALGRFNSNLQYFGKAAAKHIEQEDKYHEQMVATTGGLSSEGRKNVYFWAGENYATDKLYSGPDVKVNRIPELQREYDDRKKNWENNGYTYTDPEDPEGKPKNLTPELVQREWQEKNAEIWQTYPGKANEEQRNALLAETTRQREDTLKSMKAWRDKDFERKASETTRLESYTKAMEYHFAGVEGDAYTQGVLKEAGDMYRAARGKDTKIEGQTRDHVTHMAITSFQGKLDEPAAAEAFLKFINGKPSDKTGKLIDQPMFGKILGPMIEKANKTVNKKFHGIKEEAYVRAGMVAIMSGMPWSPSLDTALVTGDLKTEPDKLHDKIAQEVDKEIGFQFPQTPDGQVNANRARIFQFAGSGLLSGQVQANFDDIGANLDDVMSDPTKIEHAVFAYRDIVSLDPLRLNKYIKDPKTRAALNTISDIADQRGMQIGEAANLYVSTMSALQGKEIPNPFTAYGWSEKDFYKTLGNIGEMPPDALAEIKERVEVLATVDGINSKEKLKELTEQVGRDYFNRIPKINDSVLSVPPGIDPASYVEDTKEAIKHFLEQEKLPFDDGDVGVRSLPDGFFLINPKTGKPIRLKPDKDGFSAYAFFTHADILQWGRAKAEADAAKGVKKRYGNVNIGSPYLRAENMKKIEEAKARLKQTEDTLVKTGRPDAYGKTNEFFMNEIVVPLRDFFTRDPDEQMQDSIDKRFLINERLKKMREKANPK